MGRPLRIEYPGALYHVTSRGNEKKKIFRDEADQVRFLKILGDYHDRYGILIHAYVLMDNHYHLILELPRGNLLKVMHGLNSAYTGYFNRRYGRSGHLFQGRYKAIVVDKENYLLQLSRYVHLNPVRAGMVKRPEQYPWSSYRGYIGNTEENGWVESAWVLSQFGGNLIKAKHQYRKYTEEGTTSREESPLNDVFGQVVLGQETFREDLKKKLKKLTLGSEILDRKRLIKRPSVEEIIKATARCFHTKEETIGNLGGRGNPGRRAALYLLHRYSGLSNEEIGKRFGGIHPSAVSKAARRFKEEMKKDNNLLKCVEELESIVKA
jgi:putative transposase